MQPYVHIFYIVSESKVYPDQRIITIHTTGFKTSNAFAELERTVNISIEILAKQKS